MEIYQKRRQRLVRNTWWFVIAFFTALIILPAICRGEEPKPPVLVIPDTPPKLYYPRNGKHTWTLMVNYLMTRTASRWNDKYGSVIYHQGFKMGNNSGTLAYNHTNGALSLTIVELTSQDINVVGKGPKLTMHKSREVNVLTLVSLNFDTTPDLAIQTQVNLTESGDDQIGTTTLFDAIPQGKVSPRTKPKLWNKQLNYMGTWALWEVHIMEALGFQTIIPAPKEEM